MDLSISTSAEQKIRTKALMASLRTASVSFVGLEEGGTVIKGLASNSFEM